MPRKTKRNVVIMTTPGRREDGTDTSWYLIEGRPPKHRALFVGVGDASGEIARHMLKAVNFFRGRRGYGVKGGRR